MDRDISQTPPKKESTRRVRRVAVDEERETKKARVDTRHYKKSWEDLPELRGWLTQSDDNPQRAFCRYCRLSLRSHRRDLVDHSLTERHMRNAAYALSTDATNSGDGVDCEPAITKDDGSYSDEHHISEDVEFPTEYDDQPNDTRCYPAVERVEELFRQELKPSLAALTRAVRNSQRQILVIQTGGTIDKDYQSTPDGTGFETGESASQRIFERVGLEVPVVFRTVCRKDSQKITAEDRSNICDCCINSPQQRILITHGVDTLLDTAAYLSECVDLSSRIIVITGATRPEALKDSDADFNIGCAVGAVQSIATSGVYVCMHGLVARWDQVERDNTMHRLFVRAFSSVGGKLQFEHLSLTYPSAAVAHVQLNRPDKRNALNTKLWDEIGQCFNEMNANQQCRAVVLSAAGNTFCAGIDLQDFLSIGSVLHGPDLDVARKAFWTRNLVRRRQDAFTALEKCQKPVIVAIHGGCIGGGTSLISGADIRYATSDSYYSIREVELGLAADVGAIQRFTKTVNNQSLFRELVLTGRRFSGDEAQRLGIISRLFPNHDELMAASLTLAEEIASKSPVAVQGSKVQMNYARDHTVDDALEYMATWNMAMLQSEDVVGAATAVATKSTEPVVFKKL